MWFVSLQVSSFQRLHFHTWMHTSHHLSLAVHKPCTKHHHRIKTNSQEKGAKNTGKLFLPQCRINLALDIYHKAQELIVTTRRHFTSTNTNCLLFLICRKPLLLNEFHKFLWQTVKSQYNIGKKQPLDSKPALKHNVFVHIQSTKRLQRQKQMGLRKLHNKLYCHWPTTPPILRRTKGVNSVFGAASLFSNIIF